MSHRGDGVAIRPDQIDECRYAPLPENGPRCGGVHFEETHTATQCQTGISRRPIHRELTIHVGRCHDGGRRVQGWHPLQTSDASAQTGLYTGCRLKELALGHFIYEPNRRLRIICSNTPCIGSDF